MFFCNSTPLPNPLSLCSQGPQYKKISSFIYSVQQLLGRGRYSKVYQGACIQTKKQVGIKVINLSQLQKQNLTTLLFQETEILSTLNHPNIIKCYALLKSINRFYIVMELCKRDNLEVLIVRGMPAFQVQRIIYDIYHGLQYLAAKAIIHRDLKTANILFNQAGKAVIADFGFAIHGLVEFQDQVFVGTPLYMSPQALLELRYGPKTDIWSFGVIIHQLVFGYAPLSNCQDKDELLLRITQPVSLPQRSDVSPALYQLLQGCLTPNSYQRWSMEKISKCSYMQTLKKKYYIDSEMSEALKPNRLLSNTKPSNNLSTKANTYTNTNTRKHIKVNTSCNSNSKCSTDNPNSRNNYSENYQNSKPAQWVGDVVSYTESSGEGKSQKSLDIHHYSENGLLFGSSHKPRFTKLQRTSDQPSKTETSREESLTIITKKPSFTTKNLQHTPSSLGSIPVNPSPNILSSSRLPLMMSPRTPNLLNFMTQTSRNNAEISSSNEKEKEKEKEREMKRRASLIKRPSLGTARFSLLRGRKVGYQVCLALLHHCRLVFKVLLVPAFFQTYLRDWLIFLITDLQESAQLLFQSPAQKSLRTVITSYMLQYTRCYPNNNPPQSWIPHLPTLLHTVRSLQHVPPSLPSCPPFQSVSPSCLQYQLLQNLYEDSCKICQYLSSCEEGALEKYASSSGCQRYLVKYAGAIEKDRDGVVGKIGVGARNV